MPILVETESEWVARHSDGWEPILLDGRWLYPDGAVHRGSDRVEPPDGWAGVAAQIEYRRAWCERIAKAFRETRASALAQCRSAAQYPNQHPPEDAPEFLERQARAWREHKLALDDLLEQWEDSPQRRGERARAEQEQRKQELVARVEREILAVELEERETESLPEVHFSEGE